VLDLSGLNPDGLVHESGKVSEILSSKSKVNVRVEPIEELLLSKSISGNVFFSIAG
jgi:hypothetical protein